MRAVGDNEPVGHIRIIQRKWPLEHPTPCQHNQLRLPWSDYVSFHAACYCNNHTVW